MAGSPGQGYDVEHKCATASSVPDRDRLERVLPNLTRNQAIERAALVTVDNYKIVLDLDLRRAGAQRDDVSGSTTTV